MFWVFFFAKNKKSEKKIKLKNKIKLKRNKTILTAFIIFFIYFLFPMGMHQERVQLSLCFLFSIKKNELFLLFLKRSLFFFQKEKS